MGGWETGGWGEGESWILMAQSYPCHRCGAGNLEFGDGIWGLCPSLEVDGLSHHIGAMGWSPGLRINHQGSWCSEALGF
jgi:hypothetical protein